MAENNITNPDHPDHPLHGLANERKARERRKQSRPQAFGQDERSIEGNCPTCGRPLDADDA